MVASPLVFLFCYPHWYETLRPSRVFPCVAHNALRVNELLSGDQKKCRVSAQGTAGGGWKPVSHVLGKEVDLARKGRQNRLTVMTAGKSRLT